MFWKLTLLIINLLVFMVGQRCNLFQNKKRDGRYGILFLNFRWNKLNYSYNQLLYCGKKKLQRFEQEITLLETKVNTMLPQTFPGNKLSLNEKYIKPLTFVEKVRFSGFSLIALVQSSAILLSRSLVSSPQFVRMFPTRLQLTLL